MTDERKNRILNVLNNRQSNIAVVLENVDDQHNMFASLRNCDAVGVQNIYIIDHKQRSFKAGRKSSSSAKKWLTIHYYDDTVTAFEAVRKKHNKIYVTNLKNDAESIYDIDFNENIAIVFGNEQVGVSEKAIELADGNILIPQIGMIKSLNISVAVAVTLYEVYRQRAQSPTNKIRFTGKEYESMLEKWLKN